MNRPTPAAPRPAASAAAASGSPGQIAVRSAPCARCARWIDDIGVAQRAAPVAARRDIAEQPQCRRRSGPAGARRTPAMTRWPRATSAGHRPRPMNPPAPVTRMRANAPSFLRCHRLALPQKPVASNGPGPSYATTGLSRGDPVGRREPTACSFATPGPSASASRSGAAAAAEADLSGHRGLVFLVAPAARGAGGARRRVRCRRRDPRAGPCVGIEARGFAWGAALATARRRSRRHRPRSGGDRRAVSPRAAGHRPSCRAEAGAVWRVAVRLGFRAGPGGRGASPPSPGSAPGLGSASGGGALAPAGAGLGAAPCRRRARSSCRTRRTARRWPGSGSIRRGSC